MFYRPSVIIIIIIFLAMTPARNQSTTPKLKAYYTHILSKGLFELSSLTGDHADIVVDFPFGSLLFWRGTSYLPIWQTTNDTLTLPELVERRGDGDSIRPDRANTFSHVAIVASTPDSVVIHWRYLPVFKLTKYPFAHSGFNAHDFVDEYFSIYPAGTIRRLIVRGSPSMEEYQNGCTSFIQIIRLADTGFSSSAAKPIKKMSEVDNFTASINNKQSSNGLLLSLKFDEGAGRVTKVDGLAKKEKILGNKAVWKKGVSGYALQFDGYSSQIKTRPFAVKRCKDLTITANIAIGAYPWNWVPIVQSGVQQGFFVGVNASGRPGFRLTVKGQTYELISSIHLERFRWYQLKASYRMSTGMMAFYVDGKKTDSLPIVNSEIEYGESGLQIGKADSLGMPTDAVRPQRTYLSSFGFDGLIDEIVISPLLMKQKAKENNQQRLQNNFSQSQAADMQVRHFPLVKSSQQFRAYYTQLKYYESWDNLWRVGQYADIVVEFKNSPCKFIFWRGASYIPAMVNDKQQWFTNEFNETWNKSGGEGCMEPMSDKENYTSHARIIEQSSARVVVNWRVALMDVNRHVYANFDTIAGTGDWLDWYYYIYPDGFAVKKMRLYTHGTLDHEWQESIVLMSENQRPDEVLEKQPTFTAIDSAGTETAYNWIAAPPKNVIFENTIIHKTNLKSNWDIFTIQRFTGGNVYSSELTPYSVFCTWNHWPTAQISSDGRNALYPDRASHSSTTHLKWNLYSEHLSEKKPYAEKLLMEGMSDKSNNTIVQLAMSWLHPWTPTSIRGIESIGFDYSQRAYRLRKTTGDISFMLAADVKSPILHPAFVIDNWDAEYISTIIANGRQLRPGIDFQQGLVYNVQGKRSLIIFAELSFEEPVTIQIKAAKHAN